MLLVGFVCVIRAGRQQKVRLTEACREQDFLDLVTYYRDMPNKPKVRAEADPLADPPSAAQQARPSVNRRHERGGHVCSCAD